MERELIERLRKSGFIDYAAMGEAADLIESLRAQLDEARKALEVASELATAVVSNFRDMEDGDGNPAPEIRMAKRLVRTAAAIRQRGERG